MNDSRRRAAVVIPALNEEGNVCDLIEEIRLAAAAVDFPVTIETIAIVDNGSTDRTAERAAACGALVVSEPIPGYGRACLAGARACRDADLLIFMDGDRSEVPAEMSQLLEPVLSGQADFAIGSRVRGHSEPGALTPQQRVGNRVATLLLRPFYGVRVTDLGPYRVIRRADLLALGMTQMTYGWPVEMIARSAQAGLQLIEIPVTCRRRASGVSKVSGNLRSSVRAGWRIIATIVQVRRSPSQPMPKVAR